MARPIKTIKRTQRIKANFTLGEAKIIQRYAKSQGMSMSEFIRAKTLDHHLKPRLTNLEADVFGQLVEVANSLKELSEKTQERRLLTLQIIKTLDGVDAILEKLK